MSVFSMEDECSQWERLAGEFVEAGQFYQAANQYKQAADCYLERVLAMARKSAEYYHMHAESSLEKGNHRAASTSYFEAATQYRQTDDLSTALTLYENAARESLLEQMTETAAQSYLWAAYACHKLGNAEYFLTCAKNVGDLYEQAAKKALDEGKAERAVIDFSLAAMGFATIDRTKDAKELIKTAKRIIDKTRWDWLGILLSFSEALTNNKLDEAADLLRKFKEEDTIKDVMSACLDILDEREMQKK